MKLLSSRMSVYLHKKKYKCFKAPAFKKWTSHLNAGAHAWVLCDRHRPDVSAMSYLVCGCQEELNNFFNLEKKPSSCFNSPSFPSCMLSPASGGLPVLPPPEQRPTLQQWGSIRKHVCTDADVKKQNKKNTPDGSNLEMFARKRLCTCGGRGDTIYRPLRIGLILSVAH